MAEKKQPKGKEIKAVVKLQIEAGKATPAPPLGPILGQNGVAIPDFCTRFNDMSKEMMGYIVPVVMTVYEDRSFDLVLKKPPVSSLIKKKINLQKGSSTPNLVKVGRLTQAQIREIAEMKMPDFNTNNIEAGMKIVAGVAKSMGLEVEITA